MQIMNMNRKLFQINNLNKVSILCSLNRSFGRYSYIRIVDDTGSNFRTNFLTRNTSAMRSEVLGVNFQSPSIMGACSFHTQVVLRKDPESKAEKSVNLLKESLKEKSKAEEEKTQEKPAASALSDVPIKSDVTKIEKDETKLAETIVTPADLVDVPGRLTLWQRVVAECKHYYHGFKLLYFETKIMFRLLKRVLNGDTLTRRERKQFTRTAADLFRLVPFSLFIIIPFMELTLPIFIKIFPNMLPSTFKEESKEQDKLKLRLKAKLEMAKFLQDTLEETALKSDEGKRGSDSKESISYKFSDFMKKIRSKGQQPTSDEIMKYSSLFENELTLDNLTRQQLIALCKILEVSTLANIPPNHILRFQLRMRLRSLEADDKMIIKEGVDSLDIGELQQACRERGMRSIGLSQSRLKAQLEQWLDLHIKRQVPISLLMLSRAMYLPEYLAPEDMIKTTISSLPKTIEDATSAKIAEATGSHVDNKIKLELLRQEEAEIRMENEAKKKEEEAKKQVPAMKPTVETNVNVNELAKEKDLSPETLIHESIVDKALVLDQDTMAKPKSSPKPSVDDQDHLTPDDIREINDMIENLPKNEEQQVKFEIAELKKDVDEYKEDVEEIEEMKAKLRETKSAKLLSKRVQRLLSDMDSLLAKIENDPVATTKAAADQLGISKNTVSIDELISTIRQIRGVLDDVTEKKLMQVLASLDQDQDGKIDDMNDVLRVLDLIEQENVKVSKDQLGQILTLLEKEKIIEKEEEEKQQQAKKDSAQANTQP